MRGRTNDLKYPVMAMDINRTTMVRDFATDGLAGPKLSGRLVGGGGIPFFAIGLFYYLAGRGGRGRWMDGWR